MISTTTFLTLLLTMMGTTSIASHPASTDETHASKVLKAYQTLDSDFTGIQDLYANDAFLKFCWGGPNPNCSEGSVDDILLPFHQAIQTFKVKHRVLTGENDEVLSIEWYNYMETPHGCGQVTNGIATFEFNDEHKVVRHYSLSDVDITCVPQYLATLDSTSAVEE